MTMTERVMPANVKRMVNDRLLYRLPAGSQGYARVTPKNQEGKKCAAWQASYYEVFAYPISMSADLEPIAEVLRSFPGVSDITLRTADEVAGSNPIRPGVFARFPVMRQEVSW